MGFRPDRFPASLPASFQWKGTRAAVHSGGWTGIKPQDPATAGVGECLAHTLPLPSSLLLLALPNAFSCTLCPARRKHLIQEKLLQATVGASSGPGHHTGTLRVNLGLIGTAFLHETPLCGGTRWAQVLIPSPRNQVEGTSWRLR